MKKNDEVQYLIKIQQIRLFVENLIIPIMLVVFNILLSLFAVFTSGYKNVVVFGGFALFSIIMQGLVIIYSKYWRGRNG